MNWYKIRVALKGVGGSWQFYSELAVEKGDKVRVETAKGITEGTVSKVEGTINTDPFDSANRHYSAHRHVLENVTKNSVNEKEQIVMFGTKVVEVKRSNSNSKSFFYTDMDLVVGQTVVYEAPYDDLRKEQGKTGLHVGTITEIDVLASAAIGWIVDVVDTKNHAERKRRVKEAEILRKQLEQAKSQFQDIQILELIASSNPQVRDTLNKYKMLVSGQSLPETYSVPVYHEDAPDFTTCSNGPSFEDIKPTDNEPPQDF